MLTGMGRMSAGGQRMSADRHPLSADMERLSADMRSMSADIRRLLHWCVCLLTGHFPKTAQASYQDLYLSCGVTPHPLGRAAAVGVKARVACRLQNLP
jgi:hypothetical protein